MKFEWGEEKSEINYKKHHVRFEEAQTIFLDQHALEFYDEGHSGNEDRFIRLGLSEKINVLLVIFCERKSGIIRIISARIANIREQLIYEKRI